MRKNLLGWNDSENLAAIIDELEERDREVLREHFNYVLERMIEVNASDIDLGGQGSLGQCGSEFTTISGRHWS